MQPLNVEVEDLAPEECRNRQEYNLRVVCDIPHRTQVKLSFPFILRVICDLPCVESNYETRTTSNTGYNLVGLGAWLHDVVAWWSLERNC